MWPEGSINSKICSYIEVTANYKSSLKEGEVIYRFYLGEDMVGNFDIRRNTQHTITLKFNDNGSINEDTWRVDVSNLYDAVIPEISFAQTNVTLYDMEYANIPFSQFYPTDADATVTSTNEEVLKIIGYNSSGVQVQGRGAGEAKIIAKIGENAVTECNVKVEKLTLSLSKKTITVYNHFYHDIEYTISPPHAASLGVTVSAMGTNIATNYNSIPNRIIPQYNKNTTFPATETLKINITGREDVSANLTATVKPILTLRESMRILANKGNSTITEGLGIESSPRADIKLNWVAKDNISIYGDPGENAIISLPDNTIKFPIPNGANGLYRLKATVIGDDGYGSSEQEHTDAVKYCDISIYETIYLIGISKTLNRTKISRSPDIWEYENEIVAKWLAHPNSIIYPEGEVDLGLKYIYNGIEYSDSHTEQSEKFKFEFQDGELMEYTLDGENKEYKGTAPPYYLEYFFLESTSSSFINGDMLNGTPFIHIYSRQFMSGFSDDPSPDWDKIFEYVYGAK